MRLSYSASLFMWRRVIKPGADGERVLNRASGQGETWPYHMLADFRSGNFYGSSGKSC